MNGIMTVLKWRRICAVLLVSFFSSTLAMADIAVFGLSETGEQVAISVSEKVYQANLEKAVGTLHASTLAALQSRTEAPVGWLLRSAVTGLGVHFNFGMGPLIQLGVVPRFRLAFTNQLEPLIP